MRSCGLPRSDGGARVAQTAAGDGKLVGEEAVVKEVLMPEATAIGSSLERVLHVAAGTAVLQGGLDRNGGDQWWCSPASRGARVRVEQR
jgi:hypothetical protein